MLAENEIRLARYAFKTLKIHSKKTAKAFTEKGEAAALSIITEARTDWYRAITASTTATAKAFISYTQLQLGAQKATFQEIVQAFITQNALQKSQIITSTSLELVREAILKGQREGLGKTEIAELIRTRVGGGMGEARSRTIARTETHNAATYSMQQAAEETERPLIREWIAVHDERSREAHIEADGQQRELDQPFEVGGELIDRPGEGSAENAINCRCTLIYIPKSIGEL